MATDATGTPTSLGIPTFLVGTDAPTGNGDNAMMAAIDALIAARVTTPAGIVSGEVPVWNGSAFARSSVTNIGVGSIAPGSNGQVIQTTGGVTAWGTAPSGITQIFDVQVGRGNAGDPAAPAATIDSNTILGGNIPQTYKHLQLRVSGRGDAALTGAILLAKINNDATIANYYDEIGSANAASTTASEDNGANVGIRIGALSAASATASHAGVSITDLIDYTGTAFFKEYLAQSTFSTGTATASRTVYYQGGVYLSTAAITRIALGLSSGNFITGTRVTLYGLS